MLIGLFGKVSCAETFALTNEEVASAMPVSNAKVLVRTVMPERWCRIVSSFPLR